ncbi:MAG: hypothetical protein JXB62_10740 [Pirellulales bacterium]|nr:hypothetical protein [Pirellulales bacterium]
MACRRGNGNRRGGATAARPLCRRLHRLELLEERTLLSVGGAIDALDLSGKGTGEIRGSKFSDLDGDGLWDEGEPGLSRWIIYADLNRDGQWSSGEPRDVTGSSGAYALTGLNPGTYLVREMNQDGWQQTFPDPNGKATAEAMLAAHQTAAADAAEQEVAEQRAAEPDASLVSDVPLEEIGRDDFSDLPKHGDDYTFDAAGNMYYFDPAPGSLPPDLLPPEPKLADGDAKAPYPLSETFLLHSHPSATKVIHLDFDGHTTSGTSWNNAFTDGAPFDTPPYSYEGGSDFSNGELERIQRIWQRVAEDFLPFNVDVTTEEPPVQDLINSGGGDQRWGVRVCIGGSSSDWYSGGAGGVAYVGSFDWGSDTPCFVFNTGETGAAEAATHEVGHTLSLHHDGTSTEEYYGGHGSGATGWAPIMGVGYYRELVQWSKGEYADANQQEDDLYRITTQNGFSYRSDDHGSSRASAGALNLVDGVTIDDEGIIERTSDVDYFSFYTGSGTIRLDIDPFYYHPNLDILAKLYDEDGSLVASSNPAEQLYADIEANVSEGVYYLSVDGIGKGDPATAYSDYGSLGYYSIGGTVVGGPPGTYTLTIATDQVVEDIDFGNHASFDFGDAPDPSYPTLLAHNGAGHMLLPEGPRMGRRVDSESNGQPHPNALGDDLAVDDEDGVAFTTPIRAAEEAQLEIDMRSSPSAGRLNAWIDFNRDGDWDDSSEQIFDDRLLSQGSFNTLTFTVPATAAAGTTYARFRVSSASGLSYNGLANDGEVEDYQVTVEDLIIPEIVGRHLFYDDSAFDTLGKGDGAYASLAGGARGDGVVDLIITPDGVTIDTDGATISSYLLISETAIFTGEPANNLGFLQEDWDNRVSGSFAFTLNGAHLLGDIIGDDVTSVDLYEDLTVTYTIEGSFESFAATLICYTADDQAIALDKRALLPGETASLANYTSYARGINGIMIDVADLRTNVTPTAEDFQFRVGNGNDPGTWTPAPAPVSISTQPGGGGAAGLDRITILWDDHAIQGQWLQVTMLAANLGLAEDDVFYFGNAVGDAGDSTGDAQVNATDMLLARNNPRTFLDPAPIDFPYDYNRDGRVNATDMLLARNNQTHFLNALKLITAPDGKAAAPGDQKAVADKVFAGFSGDADAGPAVGSASPATGLAWIYEFEQMRATQSKTRIDTPVQLPDPAS